MKFSSQPKTIPLELFTPDLDQLPKHNRWVQLGDTLPWDKIELIYNSRLNNVNRGAGNKPARMIIGALLIKHKMNLSDRETIDAIRENPYMQYMLGLKEFVDVPVFDASLFVTIRKRLGEDDFNDMSESLLKLQIERHEENQRHKAEKESSSHNEDNDRDDVNNGGASVAAPDSDKSSSETNQTVIRKGILKIDATCSDAEVRYPTDLDILHDGCEVMERILDRFCNESGLQRPSTNFKHVHAVYAKVIKKKNKPLRELKRCTEHLLSALSRDIRIAFDLFARTTTDHFFKLKRHDRELFSTILKMYSQQKGMFDSGIHRCDDRIVSIFQPHVRPIVRGKAKAKVEFGSKIGASIVGGYTFIDHFSWDAYNESEDLIRHLRAYRKRFGYLPELLESDKIYLNRRNRRILKFLHIEVGGKPLGRPSKSLQTADYEARMAKYSGERNEIEATFGTGKRVYRADNIRAKLADTGNSWCAACYFAKNVMKFLSGLLHVLTKLASFIQTWSCKIVEFGKPTDVWELCPFVVRN